jgi:hypothetical protein
MGVPGCGCAVPGAAGVVEEEGDCGGGARKKEQAHSRLTAASIEKRIGMERMPE